MDDQLIEVRRVAADQLPLGEEPEPAGTLHEAHITTGDDRRGMRVGSALRGFELGVHPGDRAAGGHRQVGAHGSRLAGSDQGERLPTVPTT